MKTIVLLYLFFAMSFFTSAQSRRKPQEISLKEFSSGRLRIFYVPNAYLTANLKTLIKQLESNLEQAEQLLGRSAGKDWTIYLYGTWEEKGNHTNDVRLSHSDPTSGSIHCIVNESWNGIAERPEFQVLLRLAHGPGFTAQWEDYVSSGLAEVWFGKTLDDWETFLKTRNLLPNLPATLKDRQISRFVRQPWGASFARFIKQEYGWNALIQTYKTGALPDRYESRWQQKLAAIAVVPIQKRAILREFQKGMSYAYWNSYDGGYASRKSGRSLDKLKNIGVNAVASIPYGFMRSNNALDIRYPGHHIAGENDESLWALAQDAQKRNMMVMLKPQLWISHSSWPGNIRFDSHEEWNLWLDSYEKWILHYAIVAELTGADLLCIGTELVQATLSNPARWRTIIENVRHVYTGPLTYAANWGREFEELPFWDALDYIGLDNYYPVRSSESDDVPEMKAAFERQKTEIRKRALQFCRPVLFTEIGYMANSKAGMGQKEFEADDTDYDENAQQTVYHLALETYWNEPWFMGMYWWKWFSEPEDRGRTADEHSPHGRKAERTVAEWYSKSKP